ncbi:FtsX-like permease family protein [Nitrosomonas sp. sh817]|nr:FtsX-like permease family protein [Nitrosomonas sp. sh817]WMJ07897.1 FtsX-like permease family protein [Nitrosomonas sp. sh817]
MAVAGIAAISLIVAGILIMNVMLVAVSQRTAEIGLLKAIGATSGDIRRLFFAEAVWLSLTGAVLGFLLGQSGSLLLRLAFPQLPAGRPLGLRLQASWSHWQPVSLKIINNRIAKFFTSISHSHQIDQHRFLK